MVERRVDHLRRKRVAEMTAEEMRQALLVSEKTGLPNRRAFDEGAPSEWVAMVDVNGLKKFNDEYGYKAGDLLITRAAEELVGAGLNVFHDKGDEFLCKGDTYQELRDKLAQARAWLKERSFPVMCLNDRITTLPGADFCYGIGKTLEEAERSLKNQKEAQKASR